MKKILVSILTLAICISLTACGNTSIKTGTSVVSAASTEKSSAASADTTSSGSVKIGFLAPTLQAEFFIGIDDSLKADCEKLGWDYTSVSFDGDSAAAVTNIENLVTAGCTSILAMVSDTSCDAALKAAQKAGVYIIECGVVTDAYDAAINTDQYVIGTKISDMAADWINTDLGGQANILIYTTLQNQDMQNRGQGIQDEILKKCPNVKILEVVDIGKDVVGSGTTTTETMLLKYPQVNCILCYGDAAATESVEAVKAAGIDAKTFGIFSCDGTANAIKNIADGQMQRGTLAFGSVADNTVELVKGLMSGKTYPDSIDFPVNPITADNVADYLS